MLIGVLPFLRDDIEASPFVGIWLHLQFFNSRRTFLHGNDASFLLAPAVYIYAEITIAPSFFTQGNLPFAWMGTENCSVQVYQRGLTGFTFGFVAPALGSDVPLTSALAVVSAVVPAR